MKQFPKQGREPPEWVQRRRHQIGIELHRRKIFYNPWIRRGTLEQKTFKIYGIGPFDLPIEFFVSSRWHERRNKVPLACDRDSWRFAWAFWRHSQTYRGIKGHIEKYGMNRPIFVEWYINYKPGTCIHRCFAYRMENPDWPILIARTGNERIPMAWFDWGWKTIPTMILIRDCRWSKEFSNIFEAFFMSLPKGMRAGKSILRRIEEKGNL